MKTRLRPLLRFTTLTLLLASVAAGGSDPAAASASAVQPPIRVLILSGQNNHEWRRTTPKLKSILLASGRFAVEVTEHPEQCDTQTLAPFDAVLSNWNNFGKPASTNWPETARTALLDFVRGGKGFIVVHAGSSSFYDWDAYQRLAGASWKLGQTSHGSPHEFTVQSVADHPVTRGVAPFRTTDELWVRPGLAPGARVLATGDDQPLVLTTEFGQGRGFTVLMGHSAEFMDTPGFQTLLLRGVEWAASGKVTLPSNAGLGTAEALLIEAVAQYHFGMSRQPVRDLEKCVAAVSADQGESQALAMRLAGLLAGDVTREAKRVACCQLSLIGSAKEVPALARLVFDPDLGDFARLALERIPGSESEAALLSALRTSSGQSRSGLSQSLAARRSREAVNEIAKSLSDGDAATVGPAIDALGRIGGKEAAAALMASEPKIPQALQGRLSAALLRCAGEFLTAGQNGPADTILERLTATNQLPFIRTAALAKGMEGAGEKGASRLAAALGGQDEALQAGAIRALRNAGNGPALRQAAESLERLPEPLEVQLVWLLGERGDAAFVPALARTAASPDPEVRRASLAALGLAGNASAVPVLARLAGTAGQEEKQIITQSLGRLRGNDVDAAIVVALKTGTPAERPELIRALVSREATSAVPALLELAAASEGPARAEVLLALGKLGGQTACGGLVRLLNDDPAGAAAALAEIGRREGTAKPIVAALPTASPAAKAALVEALAGVGGPEALAAARAEVRAEDPALRVAAVRALANWPDAMPLDDLGGLAASTADARCKILALRGVARLAPLAADRTPERRVEAILGAMKAGGGLSEQKGLLAALAEVPGTAALAAAKTFLDDPALGAEAKAALQRLQEREAKTPIPPWDEEMAKLFASPDNLCRGAVATNLDGLTPDGQGQWAWAAVDGDPATYWDETDNQPLYWLRVQLKAQATVACVRVLGFQHQNYAPKDFEVLCDGKPVKQVRNAEYRNNLLTFDIPPTSCRTVELKISGYYGQSPAIRELGLFEKPGNTK
jgi:type 1 glutamine amidotransferase/HEAT repeat protein